MGAEFYCKFCGITLGRNELLSHHRCPKCRKFARYNRDDRISQIIRAEIMDRLNKHIEGNENLSVSELIQAEKLLRETNR